MTHDLRVQVSLTDVAGGRASEHELQLLYGLVIIRAINGETLILTVAHRLQDIASVLAARPLAPFPEVLESKSIAFSLSALCFLLAASRVV